MGIGRMANPSVCRKTACLASDQTGRKIILDGIAAKAG